MIHLSDRPFVYCDRAMDADPTKKCSPASATMDDGTWRLEWPCGDVILGVDEGDRVKSILEHECGALAEMLA